MNTSASKPSPAIVTQEAVRRLPRWALVLLCVAYVLAGFLGREPWKAMDIVWAGRADAGFAAVLARRCSD
jgi:hypothetical protein